jgi:Protein of unknown function (DUF2782)
MRAMKSISGLAAVALTLLFPTAHAQTSVLASSSSSPPPPRSGLPPPGLHARGARTQSIPLPSDAIPPSQAPAAQRADASGQDLTVSVRTENNGDVVQEYRRGGRIYMIQVTPVHGVTQTYLYNNPSGSLVADPRLGPVSPVYYTLYQWGGPAAPASGGSR